MNNKFQVGQIVAYTNGNEWIQSGEIKQVEPFGNSFQYVIINPNDNAAVMLWNAGYALGDCILQDQIISN